MFIVNLQIKKNPKKTNSWATYKKKYGTSQVYVTKNCELCISLITWQLMEKNLADHTEHFFFIFRKEYLFFSFTGIGAMEDAFWTTLLFKIWSHWWSDNKSIFRTNNRYLLLSTKSIKMVLHTILYCFWLQVT